MCDMTERAYRHCKHSTVPSCLDRLSHRCLSDPVYGPVETDSFPFFLSYPNSLCATCGCAQNFWRDKHHPPLSPHNDVLAPMFQTVNCLGRCLLLVLLQAAMESKANSTESQSTTYHERLLLIQITEKFLLLLAETIVSYLI